MSGKPGKVKILVIQTAFIGDVILSLPIVQVIKKNIPEAEVDFLCIPATADILKNNPYINDVIVYDKRKEGKGITGLRNIVSEINKHNYDWVIAPHRSFRTAIVCRLSNCKSSVSFDRSSASNLYKYTVPYIQSNHEIIRNLSLLKVLGIDEDKIVHPELFSGTPEKRKINDLLSKSNIEPGSKFICIAPGSVWFTKRYPKEKFLNLANMLGKDNLPIFLIGGKSDCELGSYLIENTINKDLVNAIGKLSILESAELIKRASLLITNDSAPLHIGNAVSTDIIAIFGATVPEFGFYPYGKNDFIFQKNGLSCRPCSIHGGSKCPIGTFECMMKISEEDIYNEIIKRLK